MSVATIPSPEAERRREILQTYKQRRDLQQVFRFLAAGAMFLAFKAWENPGFGIAGFSGPPLLFTALAVQAACVAYYAASWRCPVCGRHFRRLVSATFCRHCGTVFTTDLRGRLADPEGDPRQQAERALAADLSVYRGKRNRSALFGAILCLSGVLFIVLALADDSNLVRPDGWLYRTYGEHGAQTAVMVIGGALSLCGLAVMIYAMRASTVGVRRYTERMRALLGL
ncbi:MAG: hypothetical protein ACJ76N_12585 [Thermoanaerobaculia bacterium]